MRRIENIRQTTKNRFLNMYELEMKSDTGKRSTYFVASRAEKIEDLKISTRKNTADGVIIYSVYKDEDDNQEKLVLIRQYRCPIDTYIYGRKRFEALWKKQREPSKSDCWYGAVYGC